MDSGFGENGSQLGGFSVFIVPGLRLSSMQNRFWGHKFERIFGSPNDINLIEQSFAPLYPDLLPPSMAHPVFSRTMTDRVADIRNRVLSFIQSEQLQPGARLPSERTLAERWSSSRSAVNRAMLSLIAGRSIIKKGRCYFVPEESPPMSDPVHLLQPWAPSEGLFQSTREALRCSGREVIALQYHPADLLSQLEQMLRTRTAGLILWHRSTGTANGTLRRFVRAGIPFVTCGIESSEFSSVVNDDFEAGYLAVSHLAGLHHRRVAFMLDERSPLEYSRIILGVRAACLDFNLTFEPDSIIRLRSLANDSLSDVLRRIVHPQSPITAIICSSPVISHHLLSTANHLNIEVPGRLSVVQLGIAWNREQWMTGQQNVGHVSDPAPTAVMPRLETIAQIAAERLNFLLATDSRAPGRKWGVIRVAPVLIARASTGPAKHMRSSARRSPWPAKRNDGVRRNDLSQQVIPPYSLARNIPSSSWRFLNLKKFANRSRTRAKGGWLGDLPLLSLPSGLNVYHGVPFRVIPERAAGDYSALVLSSTNAKIPQNRSLPCEVQIPLDDRYQALYLLHAAGWAASLERIGEYRVNYRNGYYDIIPIVTAGGGTESSQVASPFEAPPNLQDWWPGFRPLRTEDCRPVELRNKEGNHPRFLYTLQWVNPRPQLKIDSLLVSLQKDAQTTLGILAVTGVLTTQKGAT